MKRLKAFAALLALSISSFSHAQSNLGELLYQGAKRMPRGGCEGVAAQWHSQRPIVQHDPGNAARRVGEIIAAFDVLATNPLIGRSAPRDKRELIIGRGSRGYVALYRYVQEIDTVFVLALRSQREAGYGRR